MPFKSVIYRCMLDKNTPATCAYKQEINHYVENDKDKVIKHAEQTSMCNHCGEKVCAYARKVFLESKE